MLTMLDLVINALGLFVCLGLHHDYMDSVLKNVSGLEAAGNCVFFCSSSETS